jgi:hypothetical protein
MQGFEENFKQRKRGNVALRRKYHLDCVFAFKQSSINQRSRYGYLHIIANVQNALSSSVRLNLTPFFHKKPKLPRT